MAMGLQKKNKQTRASQKESLLSVVVVRAPEHFMGVALSSKHQLRESPTAHAAKPKPAALENCVPPWLEPEVDKDTVYRP